MRISDWSSDVCSSDLGVSAMASVVGSVLAGLLLTVLWWGAAFLIAAPIAAVALVLVALFVPSHVAESTDPVDHLGGALATLGVAALVLGIGIVFAPGQTAIGGALLGAGAEIGRASCRESVCPYV